MVDDPDVVSEPLADLIEGRPVTASSREFAGRVWDVIRDEVDLGDAGVHTRDYVLHAGAVAVMAYREPGEVLLVRQYRHPVRREIWEPPAGMLDVPGEDPLVAAKRELWEEADVEAHIWHVLLDVLTSPGGSSEGIRIFLARDVRAVGESRRFEREAEEAGMPTRWVSVADALAAAYAGHIQGPTTLSGLFAVDAARRAGWATLRPVDTPWLHPPRRDAFRVRRGGI